MKLSHKTAGILILILIYSNMSLPLSQSSVLFEQQTALKKLT